MNKLEKFPLAVLVLFVVAGIANVTLAVPPEGATIIETLKAEPEILAIHYKPPKLKVTARAERAEDDIFEDLRMKLEEAVRAERAEDDILKDLRMKLEEAASAERAEDDIPEDLLMKDETTEDIPLWVEILDLLISDDVEDPDAESTERIEESWEDPIEQVKESFLSSLQADLEFQNIHSIERSQRRKFHRVKRLKERFPETTILDFITKSLSFNPKVFSGSRYRLMYRAQARLIQRQSSRAVWRGKCTYEGAAHRLKTFMSENGALLKEELENAQQKCARKLYSRFVEKINPN